ncbi:MAG: hypothetical protein AAGJ91_07360 [Pseudomonadota bacterium]
MTVRDSIPPEPESTPGAGDQPLEVDHSDVPADTSTKKDDVPHLPPGAMGDWAAL